MGLNKILPFSWAVAFWRRFCRVLTRVEVYDYVTLVIDGKMVYTGPRSGMPPEHAERYRKLEREMARVRKEMHDFVRSFDKP